MTTIGLQTPFWIDICASMNIFNHILCPYTDYTSASYQDTLDLSDISDFEDVMTTSSDEDIPALDDVFEL